MSLGVALWILALKGKPEAYRNGSAVGAQALLTNGEGKQQGLRSSLFEPANILIEQVNL